MDTVHIYECVNEKATCEGRQRFDMVCKAIIEKTTYCVVVCPQRETYPCITSKCTYNKIAEFLESNTDAKYNAKALVGLMNHKTQIVNAVAHIMQDSRGLKYHVHKMVKCDGVGLLLAAADLV